MQIADIKVIIASVNAVPNPKQARFRLAGLEIDTSTGRVSGPGGEVRLEPRVMAVLHSLALRPERLVSRAELLEAIWPGGEVYDEALTQCVYQLRQQLLQAGGDEACRSLIETVPKRGYLLKSKVEPLVTLPTEIPSHPKSRRQGLVATALGIVAALVVAWAVYEWRGAPEPSPLVPGGSSVAVLPFLPLVGTEREPVLEFGMADTLITSLSSVPALIVRPVSSVRRYDGMDRDVLEAGRALGVDAVVDGSVQRVGDTLRVSTRLLRVSDGAALWAATTSGSFHDIFAVQDEICTQIAAALAPKLGDGLRVARGGTSNSDAYEQYLLGRYHLARLTPRDLLTSVQHFRQAVALDPEYTQAWLGLANVQFRLPIAGEVPPLEYFPLARQAAEKALQLDPTAAEGYAMLGWIEHWFDWDWAASEAHFKRAIELNTNDTESHLGYAHLLSNTGRDALAIEEVRRAREISPNYPVAAALEGGFLLRAGRIEEAVARLEQARPLGEGFWLYHVALGGIYEASGRLDEAFVETTEALTASGGSTWAKSRMISIFVQMGRYDEARALLDEMLQTATGRYVPPYDLAVAYRALGDDDAALAMLQRGYELRDPKMVFLGIDGWPTLRERPAFQALAMQMNFPAPMQ